jgi:probable F420-dependent oxidoreductase
VKFGIVFANSGPAAEGEYAAQMAVIAEEAGFESLWTVEHVVVPAGYESEYPYSEDGRMPGGEQAAIPDPLIWLAYVAAATERIRVCTGILILPQRNPVITAKEVATLDRLSGGRLTLGVGVGWLEEEFDALGVPFAERGARTDEYISAMRTLWTEDEPTFEGKYCSFTRAISLPRPVQDPLPVVIGGHTPASARRAGRVGDGFFPARGDLPVLFDEMRAAAKEAGRDPDAIEITTGARRTPDEIKELEELGVSRVVIPPLAFDIDGLRSALEQYAEQVISAVNR